MQAVLRAGIVSFVAVLGLLPQAPAQEGASKEPPWKETQGLPPRAAPTDYQAHAQVGAVTIAADFVGHFVPTATGTPLTTEDYITVECGIFAEPGAKLRISPLQFALRVNGKKGAQESVPYGLVVKNVKDPDYEPPELKDKEKPSKGGISTGGGGGGDQSNLPPVIHIPIEIQRKLADRVLRASLAEGERALPQAGLLYFAYHGAAKGIHSVELIYEGPAGKATLALQP